MKVPKLVVIETPTWNKPIEPYRHPFTLIPNPAVAGRNLDYYRYDGRGIRGSPAELLPLHDLRHRRVRLPNPAPDALRR